MQMSRWLRAACILVGTSSAFAAEDVGSGVGVRAGESPRVSALSIDPGRVLLRGSDGRAQLVLTGTTAAGEEVDLTRDAGVRWSVRDVAIAKVAAGGRVDASADGSTVVEARLGELSARVEVRCADHGDARVVDFATEVVPIFTKLGCNAGACHGKASGQNGFRLSLLGFDPAFDLESLTRDGRGRRVFPAAPASSLVLLKATARVPHGGGKRFEVGSPSFRTIERWVAQGLRPSSPTPARLERIEVTPRDRVMPRRSGRQLRVTAHYSDGAALDVTHLAQYQSNAEDLATIDDEARVEARDGVGTAALTARFGGEVAVARVTVPLGERVPDWTEPASDNPIDRLVFKRLRMLGLPPSGPSTDDEFARRSSLDLRGVLPDPEQAAAFVASTDPDKRARWVAEQLETPEYAEFFALKWSAILKNKRGLGQLSQAGTFAFHDWVVQSIAENKPYDRFVAEILTAQGDPAENPVLGWYRQVSTLEERVDDTAQLFLGLRVQCARCHHHPYERWSTSDYYGFASIFSRMTSKASGRPLDPIVYVRADVSSAGYARDPLTGVAYPPKLLGGEVIAASGASRRTDDPRRALAAWLGRPDNPFFAPALVNRYWKHFFGRGLVEPEDDLRVTNPASNPELLDFLARDFAASGFDLKALARRIATSRAYDRSSLPNAWNGGDRRNFARYYPRRLSAEVLLDAINQVVGSREPFNGVPRGFRAAQLPDDGVASYFLDVFGRPKRQSVCECERNPEANLAQSLMLLNSPEIQNKLAGPNTRVERWARDPAGAAAAHVDELYRLCCARPPSARERDVCLEHLERKRAAKQIKQGYEDLMWVLINSKEFMFNH